MRVVLAVAAISLVAGCASSGAVIDAEPVAHPYDGPMHLKQSYADRATVLERSGAAGQALECEGEPYMGGAGDYDSGLESVQNSPLGALENWFDNEGGFMWIPTTGYQLERDDGDHVLFSYDVDDETKIAFITADGMHDWDDHDGWGVESWAGCDPAEWPADVAEALGYGVWENASGERAPVSEIQSFQGSEHCDWQAITFLEMGPEVGDEEYLRDVDGEFGKRYLRTTFDPHSALPVNATDSGYHRDGRELWLVPDHEAAYLVKVDDPNDVERWPGSKQRVGCA